MKTRPITPSSLRATVADLEKNHRILVVDDNEAIHADFRKILGVDAADQIFEKEEAATFGSSSPTVSPRARFELDFALQGEEALARVQAAVAAGRRYAMVFMDVRMPPGWDGLQTTQKVWEVDPDLQVVICTAYSDYSWENMMGMIRSPERMLILKKPFDTIEVLQIAHALTEKWSLLQAARINTAALEGAVEDRTYELQGINALLEAEIAVRKQAEDGAKEGEREQRKLVSQLEIERARLAQSEAALSLAQGVAHLGSWELDLADLENVNRNSLRWSDETCRIFGGTPHETEVSNAVFFGLVHPADRAGVADGISELLRTGEPYSVDHRILLPSGLERVVHEEARLIFNGESKRPAKIAGTVQDITERKRVEAVLHESEGRFRFLSELGDATRSLSNPDQIMATVARMLGEHLQVSRCAYAEVAADGDHFTIPGDYAKGCASIVGQFRLSDFGRGIHSDLAAGRMVLLRDVDAELLPADGADAFNAMQVKAMIACPLLKNNKLVAAMAVHHLAPRQWTEGEIGLVQEVVERCWAIMERARAELVLRESEEHLGLIVAASNDGIWEHDYLTDVVTWSDRMYQMLGLDRDTFVASAESFGALLHPDERAAFIQSVRQHRETGSRFESTNRILLRDGSYGQFLGRGQGVLNGLGKPIRMIGSLTDLTSLSKAEETLLEQAELLHLAHDAIMVRDAAGRIQFWNRGAELLYGWTSDEVHGRLVSDFLHYEDPPAVLAAKHTLHETGSWSGECEHLTKAGGTVTVRSRWTLVRDEQGQPKSNLVINTDITEQKKVEEQFLRAQRLESIGTLASGVAHDLNNILLPIMMAAPVLRNQMDPVERDKFLDIVESSAKRGAAIIKQVLTFARGAEGDRILLQPIYLVDEVSKIASQTFPKTITVRTVYEENVRILEADPTQLHQVLLNLCINARDAMPNGGELLLRAANFDADEQYARLTPGATAGPYVLLEVTDGGSGIPKDVVDKIFDPFFTTKGIGDGTGLGLSTVAGIVKSHNGFIAVESAPGRTCFKIFLPARQALSADSPLPVADFVPQGDGETILIVDDEPAIREVAQFILETNGYCVLIAEDGSEALALFALHMSRIAAIVTDLAMPIMSGLILVRALRRIRPSLKVIVSTGGADELQTAEIAALRVDAWLTKPFTTRDLLLKLSHVLHGDIKDAA
jgi:PAS domain S-box-containing protein